MFSNSPSWSSIFPSSSSSSSSSSSPSPSPAAWPSHSSSPTSCPLTPCQDWLLPPCDPERIKQKETNESPLNKSCKICFYIFSKVDWQVMWVSTDDYWEKKTFGIFFLQAFPTNPHIGPERKACLLYLWNRWDLSPLRLKCDVFAKYNDGRVRIYLSIQPKC